MSTNSNLAGAISDYDKVLHLMAFLLESWLFVKIFASRTIVIPVGHHEYDLNQGVLVNTGGIELDKYLLSVIVCSVCAGIGSEYLQRLLSNGRRSFDPIDMAYNVFGSLIGILIAYIHDR